MSAPLYERYRPTSLADVIGQPKAVKRIQTVGNPGGKSYWISGASGTGKTTLAEIIAREIADDWFITTITGRQLGVKTIREIEQVRRLCAWGKGGRAWIINEAHGLSEPTIELLLDLLEPIPASCTFIFTTTRDGQAELFENHIDAHPLLSRCVVLELTSQGLAKAAAPMLRTGAQAEGLDGQPPANYIQLMHRCHNNIREAWNEIQSGAMKA